MQFEILPVTRFEQNCSILWCEKTNRAAVVDPGGDISQILSFMEMLDLTPEVALVTHGHFDHCGGAARFAELTGARIEGPHHADAHLVERLGQQGRFLLGAQARSGGSKAGDEDEIVARLPQPVSNNLPRRYTPQRWLEHGDTIRFGEQQLEVLHCPGHTRGHVAYFSRSARQAFVGDILFRGTIGAWEHRDGDLLSLIDSIRNRLFPLGDDVAFVPGHGETSTFGRERQKNALVSDEVHARLGEKARAQLDAAHRGKVAEEGSGRRSAQ